LKAIYNQYKDKKNPPVTVKTIKKFLKLEGIPLDENDQ
jgi:hypothetical protein